MKEMRRTAKERLAFEDRNTLMIMGEALFAGMVLKAILGEHHNSE